MARKPKRYGKKNTEMYAVYQVAWAFGSPTRWPVVAWPSVKECREWIESRKGDGGTYMVEAMPVVMKSWDGTTTENLDPSIR